MRKYVNLFEIIHAVLQYSSFTTNTEASILMAVNKVGLVLLPSHPGFSTNAIVTAHINCFWATPARKKQFLLLFLPLSSHHSNKELCATVFVGIQKRIGSKTAVVVFHKEGKQLNRGAVYLFTGMPTVHWHFPNGEGSTMAPPKRSQSKEQDVTLNTTEKLF